MLSELDQGDALIIGEEDLARHLQEDKSNSRFSPIRRYAFFLRAKLQLSASPEKQLDLRVKIQSDIGDDIFICGGGNFGWSQTFDYMQPIKLYVHS